MDILRIVVKERTLGYDRYSNMNLLLKDPTAKFDMQQRNDDTINIMICYERIFSDIVFWKSAIFHIKQTEIFGNTSYG